MEIQQNELVQHINELAQNLLSAKLLYYVSQRRIARGILGKSVQYPLEGKQFKTQSGKFQFVGFKCLEELAMNTSFDPRFTDSFIIVTEILKSGKLSKRTMSLHLDHLKNIERI